LVQGLGLEFAPLPWDTQAALGDARLRGRLLAGDVVGFFRRAQAQAWERHQELWQAVLDAARQADVLVSASTTEDLVAVLGQALHKPVIQAELAPFSPSGRYAAIGLSLRSLGPFNGLSHQLSRSAWWWLNRALAQGLAQQLGLPQPWASPSLRALRSGTPVLHGFSPSLFPIPSDWRSAQHAVTGAWQLGSAAQGLAGDHQDAGFAHWLEDGPPPVFLSFGSMPALEGGELLELAGDVAEALECRVVLGLGWTSVDSPDCDLPEGVALSGDCDHAWLLARCSAMVHHGGAGSTHTAAAAGLPQVVCPLFADQPFWADRVRRQGAGVVLPYRRLNAGSLSQALAQALEEPVQDAAARLGQALQAEGGADLAAEHLRAWAQGGA
jgi:sterol 3beta-glucosyltransferase